MQLHSKLLPGIICLAALLPLCVPAAGAVKDACTVVSSADAEAALGEPVGPPKPGISSGASGEGSTCRFSGTQGSVLSRKSLSVSVQYPTDDASGSYTGITANLKAATFKNVHDVSGVGDHAVWGITGSDKRPMDELTVLKGKHTMVIIVISGMQDEAAALNRAKALAVKVLPKT